jgi:predicted transcriptional regulator
MKQVTISARIPEELSEQLTALARALRRNRSWVIEEALRGYITSEVQFIEAVNEGIRAADAGDLLDQDDVMKELDELLATYPRGSA